MDKTFKPNQPKSSTVWTIILLLIVNVPLLLILFSFPQISALFIALLAVPLVIDGVLLSLVFFTKKMKYTVENNVFSISFGFSKRKIPYSTIKDVKVSETTLVFRLFGASWPGLHWGLYTTKEIGKVWVYSTKMCGEFVLIELVNGNKILVSPEDSLQLCKELSKKRTQFGTVTDVQTLDGSNKFVYLQVATVAGAFFVFLGYLLWIYPSIPEIIPVHFDLNNVPNRWGNKSELFLIAAIAAIFPVLNSVLVLKFGKYAKTITILLGIIFVILMIVFLGIVYFIQTQI